MDLQEIMGKVSSGAFFKRRGENRTPPVLKNGARFPYGPFKFETEIPKGVTYAILASTDLLNWLSIASGKAFSETLEYVDSDASKFSFRFYRVVAGEVSSANILGFASVTLAPGFSLISNPFETTASLLSDLFKSWPDGTTLSKFDTRLFKLAENELRRGSWIRPSERLMPGEGAIFYNPTSDYKSHNFVGNVVHGRPAVPVPQGFSLRASVVPRPGRLVEDLHFPIADGDVIHLFDRDRQQYVLYPFQNGQWTAGTPTLSVGESFWVAKSEPGNWVEDLELPE